ncbi:phosphatase PAP2 family protein [Pontibacter litorisediminis]|uniref:phosphatase PAP2 family protein n=1 Tax=Pontibacter litorisediminis TaxID=1846260 RepID=UPI0023EA9565|nr:phosphatase PAP2 family protein [Pontibacter litorisediminis]
MLTAHPESKHHGSGIWLTMLVWLFCYGVQAQGLPSQPDTTFLDSYIRRERSFGPAAEAAATSIGRARCSPFARGAAVVVAGAGIWTATFAWADEPIQQYTQSHRRAVSDQLSSVVEPLGRPGYMAPLAGAAFAGGVFLNDAKLQKAGLVSLGSILISTGVTSILKNEFHRYRPSETTENHFFDGPAPASSNTSLPSAHTATAFAVATSVANVYGREHKFVKPLAYGAATLVGLSRINDNAHWATDVMAGAAVGYLSAKGAIYLYDMAHQKQGIHRQRRLLVTPQPGLHSGGVSATLVF